MEKIYGKAKDKNVAAVVLYVSNTALYYDEACENAVAYAEDAIDLFLNGAVIYVEGEEGAFTYVRPASVSNLGVMTYGADGETAELSARPEPELPEDVHTIPQNKWNNPEAQDANSPT